MRVRLQRGLDEIGLVSRRFAEGISILSGARALHFGSEEEVVRFLERFLHDDGNRSSLGLGPAGPGDRRLLRSLAGRIMAGELLVISSRQPEIAVRHERPIYATPRELATASPPPPSPSPRPEAPPEKETMVPNPAAQAAVFQAASESGAPLCEP